MNNAYIRAQQCKVKEAKFPFVKIGSQYWTTKNLSLAVTPKGNTIPEVQANGNVEKITQPLNFLSGWNWIGSTNKTANSWTTTGPSQGPYFQDKVLIGRWYKIVINATVSDGNIILSGSEGGGDVRIVGNGTVYFKPTTENGIWLKASNAGVNVTVNSFSVQEIGWSGSQELYDGIYAQTSGTVEQKTYAAVKAAAMWSNYNNDPVLGGIYGKLYNWFAVKLFQMDIDYYNAANPTKPYIWRMPTQAEFKTLSNFLGGDAVSGGHLKEAGLAHWNSPNTGADNSSGFCATGNGWRRHDDGSFSSIYTVSKHWSVDMNIECALINANILTYVSGGAQLLRGYGIRLIKA